MSYSLIRVSLWLYVCTVDISDVKQMYIIKYNTIPVTRITNYFKRTGVVTLFIEFQLLGSNKEPFQKHPAAACFSLSLELTKLASGLGGIQAAISFKWRVITLSLGSMRCVAPESRSFVGTCSLIHSASTWHVLPTYC